MRLARRVFFLFMFLLPLDGSRYLSFFVGPLHVSIVDLLLVVMILMVLLRAGFKSIGLPRFAVTVSALLLAAAAASSISMFYIAKPFGRYDLRMTLNFLEFVGLILVAATLLRNVASVRRAMLVFALSVVTVSALTVLKSLGLPVPGMQRATVIHLGPFMIGTVGVLDDPMAFACLVLAAFPLVLSREMFERFSLRAVFGALLAGAAVISFSRGLWLALIGEAMVFALFAQSLERRVVKRALILSMLGAALAVIFFAGFGLYDATVQLRPGTVAERVAGYRDAFALLTSNPAYAAFGVGKGAFVAEVGTVPHNFLLDIMTSKGLLTLLFVVVALGLILGRLLRYVWEGRRRTERSAPTLASLLLVGLIGMIAEGMTAPITDSTVFWAVIAVASAFVTMYREQTRSEEPTRGGPGAGTLAGQGWRTGGVPPLGSRSIENDRVGEHG